MLYSPTKLPELGHRETGTIHVINPSMTDFEMHYLDDANNPQTVTIKALETQGFEAPLAHLVITHLANHILNLKEYHYKEDVNIELARIKEEITLG